MQVGLYWYYLPVWCAGPVQSVVSVTVEGTDPAFTTVNTYTGTSGQSADALMQTAIAGYTDTLAGVCYSAVRVAKHSVAGFPRFTARIQGRKVYDPRRDPTHPDYSGSGSQALGNPATWEYSTNPALCLADFITSTAYGMAWDIDWASVADVADECDTVVSGGGKRRTLNLYIDKPSAPEDVLDTLRRYAGCWIVPRGSGVVLVADRPASPTRTLDASKLRDLQITIGSVTGQRRPNKVTVVYTDTGSDPWRDAEASVSAPELVGGQEIEVEEILRLPGITSYEQAYREAVESLNRHRLLNLRLTWTTQDEGLQDEIGDVVSITHLYGLTTKQVRLLSVDHVGGGDYAVSAEEYQPNVYSDAVESEPAFPDTDLPLPSAIPTVTGLSLAEQVYKRTDGIWDTRIRASWDAIDYPFRFQYRVEVTADGAPVATINTPATQADIVSPTEGATYSITVYAANFAGDEGSGPSEEIVPLGEGIPPTDVPQVTITRISASSVLVSWLPAVDVGVLEYEVRLGASWDSATFVDRASVLERRIDGLSGSGTVLVKARDSRGNYSVNATSATYNITAPPDPLGLAGFEVGGEVRLTVTPPATGYVARYEWRYGSTSGFSWSGATLIDITDTLRLVSKEIPAGTWRFAVKSVDDAGQSSTGYVSRDMAVTEDAGAFLAANQALTPNLGSSTNMHLLANPWGDAVATYYTSMGDSVASRWPSAMATYTNPLATYHSSGTSELLTDSHNFGSSINGTWSLDYDVSELSGDGADIQLEVSSDGAAWTQIGTAAKTVGQYARARIGGATVDTLVVSVPDLTVRVDAVPREEQGASSYATGKHAWEVDGTGDWATAADAAALDITGDMTIECWVRRDTDLDATAPGVAQKGPVDATFCAWCLRWNGFAFQFGHGNGSTTAFVTLLSPDNWIKTGRWAHVAAVRTASTRTIELYINGILRTWGNYSASVLPAANSDPMYLGSRGGFSPLTGALRDVRLWNVARTQTQIQDNLTADLTGGESGLVGYWLTTNSYADATGNGHTLTPAGDPQFIPQGQRIFLDNTYAAVQSVTITPTGSSFRAGVADNLTPAEGASFFDAFLFDADGNLANGNFQWFWKGA